MCPLASLNLVSLDLHSRPGLSIGSELTNAKWTKHQCKQLKRTKGRKEKNRRREEHGGLSKVAESVRRGIAEARNDQRSCVDLAGTAEKGALKR